MYHSITFDDKNTWDDWHLIPSSRPTVSMPEVKTKYIDLPGANGSLDLTSFLTGRPLYSPRTGNFEFIVMNDYGNWIDRYSEIANYLHGQVRKMFLEDDEEFYYEGRFTVDKWQSGTHNSSVTISYNVYPYKKQRWGTLEGDWLWDPFDFEKGVIENLQSLVVNGAIDIQIRGDVMPASPIFTSDSQMTVEYDNEIYTIPKGTSRIYGITLKNGINNLTITGHGKISVDYRGGRL